MLAKIVKVDGLPYPVFFARRLIKTGEELVYNYGRGDYFWRNGEHFF